VESWEKEAPSHGVCSHSPLKTHVGVALVSLFSASVFPRKSKQSFSFQDACSNSRDDPVCLTHMKDALCSMERGRLSREIAGRLLPVPASPGNTREIPVV